jgi:hypothetical protein
MVDSLVDRTTKAPLVFILSWERPLYLWACLDSLYRNTTTSCRFVLIDNASADPLVHQVIESFGDRGLFHDVRRRRENTPAALAEAVEAHAHEIDGYFGFIEGDVEVLPAQPCWLSELISLTAENPKLAMLGSLVDKRDFVDPALAARRFPRLDPAQIEFLIKSNSPERQLLDDYAERMIDPFNPPGRLLFLKKQFIDQTGILRDRLLYEACKRLGYEAGIATRVRHRHLSFQNIYDYPGLDIEQRHAFFSALEAETKR